MKTEKLANRHEWLRIADPSWDDALNPGYAARTGGRWNPPGSFPTLYLSEDRVTARFNLALFISDWPYTPEDLRDDTGPVLVRAILPRDQVVADCHTPEGIFALGLPASYPWDASGRLIPHPVCQRIGEDIHARTLRGVRCRSAQVPAGAGRELAWFPASRHSRAREVGREAFAAWYW
jgi:hypothetical protein